MAQLDNASLVCSSPVRLVPGSPNEVESISYSFKVLGEEMGIAIKGLRRRRVPEVSLHHFHVGASRDEQRGCSVSEVVNPQALGHTCHLANRTPHPSTPVRDPQWLALRGSEQQCTRFGRYVLGEMDGHRLAKEFREDDDPILMRLGRPEIQMAANFGQRLADHQLRPEKVTSSSAKDNGLAPTETPISKNLDE